MRFRTIVLAVAVLAMTLTALGAAPQNAQAASVRATSYPKTVCPGQQVDIRWTVSGGGRVTYNSVQWGASSSMMRSCTNSTLRTPYSTSFSAPSKGDIYFRVQTRTSRGYFRSNIYKISVSSPNTSSRSQATSSQGSTTSQSSTRSVSTPSFTKSPGTYIGSVSVGMSCSTSGAVIRYTTNGSTPTSRSSRYSGTLTISRTTTLKARAFRSGMSDSSTKTATYTINQASKPQDCVERPKDPSWYKYIPRYGNYGGPGHSGPGEPVDYMDSLFKQHDEAYAKAKSQKDIRDADAALANKLLNMSFLQKWFLGRTGRSYRRQALFVFIPKGTMGNKSDKPFCQ